LITIEVKMRNKTVIKSVRQHSIAQKVGLEPGWEIITINGQKIKDFLHYRYLITDENIDLEVAVGGGLIKQYSISKDFDEPLGIEFEDPLMDNVIRCKNKCIFCFVDQMPKKLRHSLYVKDDDYRLSFASGTYITLTNLSDEDFNRIVSMHMSPLYVSVHSTIPTVRTMMLQNPNSGCIMEKMDYLRKHDIFMHCQVVLCPGINDGEILNQTIKDLMSLCPNVLSIAIVPVGLTVYRQNLYPLRPFTQNEARLVIDQIHKFQRFCSDKLGSRLVFAADELYIRAGLKIPSYEAYEDFYQLENGVGMVALLKKEIEDNIKRLPSGLLTKRKISIATGISAGEFLEKFLSPLKNSVHLDFEIYPIKNNFFGDLVTVAGLITGRDLIDQLSGKGLGEELLIPEVMLKEGELFLDDCSVDDVRRTLGVFVTVVRVDGKDLLEKMIGVNMEA
jgi:putative radical SAM enzyme (TIGR03279 family)